MPVAASCFLPPALLLCWSVRQAFCAQLKEWALDVWYAATHPGQDVAKDQLSYVSRRRQRCDPLAPAIALLPEELSSSGKLALNLKFIHEV